jgi:peptidoglycan/LPS O-acetylase OafA/YrhL
VLESRIALAVGVSSYSLFLWHEPLIHWLQRHDLTLPGWGGLAANIVIVAVLAGAIATLSYRYVEMPALRRKRPMIRAERHRRAATDVHTNVRKRQMCTFLEGCGTNCRHSP